MPSILNRALSWVITSFGNKFCLKKRSRLIKALDNRFHAKFMQLEIGLLTYFEFHFETETEVNSLTGLQRYKGDYKFYLGNNFHLEMRLRFFQ